MLLICTPSNSSPNECPTPVSMSGNGIRLSRSSGRGAVRFPAGRCALVAACWSCVPLLTRPVLLDNRASSADLTNSAGCTVGDTDLRRPASAGVDALRWPVCLGVAL